MKEPGEYKKKIPPSLPLLFCNEKRENLNPFCSTFLFMGKGEIGQEGASSSPFHFIPLIQKEEITESSSFYFLFF
jgi:hypothetical protein